MSKKQFKKVKEKKDKKEKSGMHHAVLVLLEEDPSKALNPAQITRRLGLKKKALIKELYLLLDNMEDQGLIFQDDHGGYKTKKHGGSLPGTGHANALTGNVDHVNQRFAYITGNGEDNDIYVSTRDLRSAMHGDTVKVAVSSKRN